MNKLLHNQIFWRIIWAYTLIIYPYFFGTLLITGEEPIIISETFTKYLFIVSGIQRSIQTLDLYMKQCSLLRVFISI